MKATWFLFFYTLLWLSCQKDFGPIISKEENKDFLVFLNFITQDSNRVLLNIKIDSVSQNNLQLLTPKNINASLRLKLDQQYIYIIASKSGVFKIDSAFTMPINSLIYYELIVNNDTVNGEIEISEPILYEERPVNISYGLEKVTITHNLKCNFEEYGYMTDVLGFVEGTKLKSSNNISDFALSQSICIPLLRYPSNNYCRFSLFKIRNEFKDNITNGSISTNFVNTRPLNYNININKGRLYGFVQAITLSSFEIYTPDESKKMIELVFLDKSGNNPLSTGFKIKQIDFKEKLSTSYFVLKNNINFQLYSNSAIVTLFEIGNIFNLCPEQLINFSGDKKNYVLSITLLTPDNKEIKFDSDIFNLESTNKQTLVIEE